MKSPDTAVILAAGLGQRLDPLTRILPKALVPFWHEPVLDRTFRMLAGWGVREILVNLHHLAGTVVQAARAKASHLGIRLCFSFEPNIAGTGGALRKADWFLGQTPFWLINADVIADVRPEPFLKVYDATSPLAVLWVTSRHGPRTVTLRDGVVTSFRNGSPAVPESVTFCGLHLLSPAIRRYLPTGEPFSIVAAYEDAIRHGRAVRAVEPPDTFWADIGTPDEYLNAHFRYPKRRATGRPRADHRQVVDPSARIHGHAEVSDSVVMANAVLGPRARLHRAIVTPGTRIDGPASGIVVSPEQLVPALPAVLASTLRWPAGPAWIESLPARGSARSFYRVRGPLNRSSILVSYTLERPENALYADHVTCLNRARLPVPRVLWRDDRSRLLLLADVGETSLLDVLQTADPATFQRWYRKAIRIMFRWHREGGRSVRKARRETMEPFGPALFRWEHDLFFTHIVLPIRGVPSSLCRSARRDLNRVSSMLLQEPRVLLHRDFQSTNLLVQGERLFVIDFQGMRWGPAVYDLASLLADPYVRFPPGVPERLLDYYCHLTDRPPRVVIPLFHAAVVQRLTQALGAFGRLGAQPGTRRFLRHIPSALGLLVRTLDHLPALSSLRQLAMFLLANHGDDHEP